MKNVWQQWFDIESSKPYFKEIMKQVDHAYATSIVYPCREDLFSCFDYCDVNEVRVVILGQDPYHQPGQAHGLSFSVSPQTPIPPSLRNIYKELESDLSITRKTGDLSDLARKGVLLLNANLTVEQSKAGSHRCFNWEQFTDEVIRYLNKQQPMVFVLWGSDAIKKQKLITNPEHLILTSVHPSPLSAYRGFFGSKPFSKINNFLTNKGYQAIDWSEQNV